MRQQLKLWDSKRERELPGKSANGTHCRPVRRPREGLSNSREELAGGGLAHPPPEAGGRGEGKGANSAPETAPLPNCKQASSL